MNIADIEVALEAVASFAPVPGHPGFLSDTPVLASLLLEEPWSTYPPRSLVAAVGMQIDPHAARQVTVLEPTAVHDPQPAAITAGPAKPRRRGQPKPQEESA
jgi:hypothetical protein